MGNDHDVETSSLPANGGIQQLRSLGLYAVGARVDHFSRKLLVKLYAGIELNVPLGLIQELHESDVSDLSEIEISPSGLGLYFPKLDADILISGLLQGVMGSPVWMAGHPERIEKVRSEDQRRAIQLKMKQLAKKETVKERNKAIERRAVIRAYRILKQTKGDVVMAFDEDLKVAARRPGTPPKVKKR
ncbi:DUF2442 domain-containing protein [Pseudomonas atagonensis]|uniref:DUF2442 domain-containing protein n=1 Tax=Pseudomonas atagonensis TaxID=2609964 RepID=UPI00140A921F|nr:DUF2442 domain-containing protein [Pseudomonas atagonensis]